MSDQKHNNQQKRKERAQVVKLIDHNYIANKKANDDPKMDDELSTDSEATPVESPNSSPTFKVKKKKRNVLSLEDIQANILAAVNQRADNLEVMVRENKSVIEELKTSLNFAFVEIEALKNENKKLAELCNSHEKVFKSMESRLTEAERYRRRWALRLYGLPEDKEENIKQKVVNICQRLAPNHAVNQAIDVVHRVGRKDTNNTRARCVIILSHGEGQGLEAGPESRFPEGEKAPLWRGSHSDR
ncbi:hypothetical protein UPYG_G00061200 [Umbra pygmaea]|uniref:Uncharacterized protein n=1 Tax=Umbra pygmaea TaxID=75934 RepID=A0ABD0XRA9_UMBPY